jgi:hypothetical protein
MKTATPTETLKDACAALGLTYSAQFVPFSQSRNAKPAAKVSDYSLNWRVTLAKGGRSLTCDYSAGIAHIPGYKQTGYNRMSVDEAEAIRRACETGQAPRKAGLYIERKIPAPELHDVLHSLVLDASALDAGSFEEWAGDFGYETDSRTAEKIYQECIKHAIELRAMIGETGIESVRVAGEDY